MTRAEMEFRNSQGLRDELAQILMNPTLKTALEAIRSIPDEFPAQVQGVHYDLVLARECSRTIGVNSAIKRLHDLTRPIAAQEDINVQAERPQWMDNLPPEMAEALKKLQQQQD